MLTREINPPINVQDDPQDLYNLFISSETLQRYSEETKGQFTYKKKTVGSTTNLSSRKSEDWSTTRIKPSS